MSDLYVNEKTIETVGLIFDSNATANKAIETRQECSVKFFEPASRIGATFKMLGNPVGDDARNNLHIAVRKWAYAACATVMVGETGLAFLNDVQKSGRAELPIESGKMKGQVRSKKYIQQQVGKLINLIKADIKNFSEPVTKVASNHVERTHYDRFLDTLAKAAKQCAKAKAEGSIPNEYSRAFNELMTKLK